MEEAFSVSAPDPLPADSAAALMARQRSGEAVTICDVRRQPAFAADPWTIPGALRRPPEAVQDWAGGLPQGALVVVYCVHGHEVSQGVARALRMAGIDARYLEGGIEGWRESGGPLEPFGSGPSGGAA